MWFDNLLIHIHSYDSIWLLNYPDPSELARSKGGLDIGAQTVQFGHAITTPYTNHGRNVCFYA